MCLTAHVGVTREAPQPLGGQTDSAVQIDDAADATTSLKYSALGDFFPGKVVDNLFFITFAARSLVGTEPKGRLGEAWCS